VALLAVDLHELTAVAHDFRDAALRIEFLAQLIEVSDFEVRAELDRTRLRG
jgi:hypothetical protein